MAIDPLTLTHDYILDQFSQDTDITDIIPTTRFVDFNSKDIPDKRLAPSDYPALELAPVGIQYQLKGTSTSSIITLQWEIRLVTADKKLYKMFAYDTHKGLFKLTWALTKRLHNLRGDNEILHDSASYPINMHLDVDDAAIDLDFDSKKSLGWLGILRVNTVLYIPRSELDD